jgi:hypothetical protein
MSLILDLKKSAAILNAGGEGQEKRWTRYPGAASMFNARDAEHRETQRLMTQMPTPKLAISDGNFTSPDDVVKGLGFGATDETLWAHRVARMVARAPSEMALRKAVVGDLRGEALEPPLRAELGRRILSLYRQSAGGKPLEKGFPPKKGAPPAGGRPPMMGAPDEDEGNSAGGDGAAGPAPMPKPAMKPGGPMGKPASLGGKPGEAPGGVGRNPAVDAAELTELPDDKSLLQNKIHALHEDLKSCQGPITGNAALIHMHNDIKAQMRAAYRDPNPEIVSDIDHKIHHFKKMLEGPPPPEVDPNDPNAQGDPGAGGYGDRGGPPKPGAMAGSPPSGRQPGKRPPPPPMMGKSERAKGARKGGPPRPFDLGRRAIAAAAFDDFCKGAGHKYLRRLPTGKAKPRYRYIYNAAKAVDTKARPSVGEKIKVDHNGQAGHYEVKRVMRSGQVEIHHDETGHRMVIHRSKLHDLVRDVHAPAKLDRQLENQRLDEAHRKVDMLPRSKQGVLDSIKAASGIDDHDLAQADAAYAAWKGRGRKGPKPTRAGKGGELDSFSGDLKRGKHYSSLLEAFEVATKGAKTWRDIAPVIQQLREVPGFENAHLPEDALLRHAMQDREREDAPDTRRVDPETYGSTLSNTVDDGGFDWTSGEQHPALSTPSQLKAAKKRAAAAKKAGKAAEPVAPPREAPAVADDEPYTPSDPDAPGADSGEPEPAGDVSFDFGASAPDEPDEWGTDMWRSDVNLVLDLRKAADIFDGVSKEEARGLARALNVDMGKIDLAQWKRGIAHEREHSDLTRDPVKIARIALAHLKEDPSYYVKLGKMEKADGGTVTMKAPKAPAPPAPKAPAPAPKAPSASPAPAAAPKPPSAPAPSAGASTAVGRAPKPPSASAPPPPSAKPTAPPPSSAAAPTKAGPAPSEPAHAKFQELQAKHAEALSSLQSAHAAMTAHAEKHGIAMPSSSAPPTTSNAPTAISGSGPRVDHSVARGPSSAAPAAPAAHDDDVFAPIGSGGGATGVARKTPAPGKPAAGSDGSEFKHLSGPVSGETPEESVPKADGILAHGVVGHTSSGKQVSLGMNTDKLTPQEAHEASLLHRDAQEHLLNAARHTGNAEYKTAARAHLDAEFSHASSSVSATAQATDPTEQKPWAGPGGGGPGARTADEHKQQAAATDAVADKHEAAGNTKLATVYRTAADASRKAAASAPAKPGAAPAAHDDDVFAPMGSATKSLSAVWDRLSAWHPSPMWAGEDIGMSFGHLLSKAMGVEQAGHKYIKRTAKAGGGYDYVYADEPHSKETLKGAPIGSTLTALHNGSSATYTKKGKDDWHGATGGPISSGWFVGKPGMLTHGPAHPEPVHAPAPAPVAAPPAPKPTASKPAGKPVQGSLFDMLTAPAPAAERPNNFETMPDKPAASPMAEAVKEAEKQPATFEVQAAAAIDDANAADDRGDEAAHREASKRLAEIRSAAAEAEKPAAPERDRPNNFVTMPDPEPGEAKPKAPSAAEKTKREKFEEAKAKAGAASPMAEATKEATKQPADVSGAWKLTYDAEAEDAEEAKISERHAKFLEDKKKALAVAERAQKSAQHSIDYDKEHFKMKRDGVPWAAKPTQLKSLQLRTAELAHAKMDLEYSTQRFAGAAKERAEQRATRKAAAERHVREAPERTKVAAAARERIAAEEARQKAARLVMTESTKTSRQRERETGEHIAASAKDRSDERRMITTGDLGSMTFSDAHRLVNKRNAMPVYGADEFQAKGASPGAAHMGLALANLIAPSPPEDSDDARRRYLEGIRLVHGVLDSANTVADYAEARKELAAMHSGDNVPKTEIHSAVKKTADEKAADVRKYQADYRAWQSSHSGTRPESPQDYHGITTYPGNYIREVLTPRVKAQDPDLEVGYEYVDSGGAGERLSFFTYSKSRKEAMRKTIDALGKRFVDHVVGDGKVWNDAKAKAQEAEDMGLAGWDHLDKTDEEKARAREATKAEKAKLAENESGSGKETKLRWRRSISKKPAVIGAKVTITDSDPERFRKTFNFRGEQPGEAIPDAELNHHRKYAEMAFHDLADVLGIEPRQVSMNGRLAMAFAARGKGGAMAHYEPAEKVINVTRFAGAGTVAHEWGHFMDNIVAELHRGGSTKSAVYASAGEGEGMPAELAAAYAKFNAALKEPNPKTIERLKKDHADLDKEYEDTRKMLREHPANTRADKTPEQRKADVDSYNVIVKNLGHISTQQKLIQNFLRNPTSDYMHDAIGRDGGRRGKYWSNPQELFARAFESHVQHKLESQGRRNSYLVDGAVGPGSPYPQDDELSKIHGAIGGIITAIHGAKLFEKALKALSSVPLTARRRGPKLVIAA